MISRSQQISVFYAELQPTAWLKGLFWRLLHCYLWYRQAMGTVLRQIQMDFEIALVPPQWQSADNSCFFPGKFMSIQEKIRLSLHQSICNTSPTAFLASPPTTDLNYSCIQPHFTASQTPIKAFTLFLTIIILITVFRKNKFLVCLQGSPHMEVPKVLQILVK